MRVVIFDVYCVWNCDIGKMSVYVCDKIATDILKKWERVGINDFLHEFSSTVCFTSGTYDSLRRIDGKEIADIICIIWHMLHLCGLHT